MKSIILKSGLFLLLTALVVTEVNAQRQPTRRRTGSNPVTQDTTGQQVNNVNRPSGYDPYGGVPIRVDSTGVGDTAIRKSLRNDNAFDKSNLSGRTPLPYENLRWDDALYAEKVWRELDLREKMNQTFRYDATDDNGSQLFINMLMKAVNSGEVTAFADDRFTTPMTTADVSQLTLGKVDTTAEYDIKQIDKIISYVVTRASFDAKSVVKLRIKEEWVFDRESSRMFVRILGGTSVMYWVYYPDLRPMLSKAEVYNPKNMGQNRMTWEELFESRMFSSYIVRSTLDNSSNKNIRAIIRDPILALLEGDNIKEKIFNYEQDLWSY